jgi:hypothetical protein
MRYLIVMLFCIHAMIHLVGVVRQWELAPATASTRAPVRVTASANRQGALWLTTCLVLFLAAALLMHGNDRWWIVAAGGVAFSQLVIAMQWTEAKAGTLVNIVLGLAILVGWAHERFAKDGEALARDVLGRGSAQATSVVEPQELAKLPVPVQGWLNGVGVVGKPRDRSVRLQQEGGLRTSADGNFMPAQADQYFNVLEPNFVWRVRVAMFHVPVYGRDSYIDGKGRMLIKALGLAPIVDAEGSEIDQGTLLRFLAEMVWYPSAALAPYIRWEAIDPASARATMTHAGVSGSADFFFDAQGRIERIAALRYMQQDDGAATLQRWVVHPAKWEMRDGVLVPVEGEVTWELKDGDFTYYRWRLGELQRNVDQLYKDAP